MILLKLLILGLLTAVSYQTDTTWPQPWLLGCAGTFCQTYRNALPKSAFRADLTNVNVNSDGKVNLKLHNSEEQILDVTLSLLDDGNFRLIINDNLTRYHLENVLDGEPKIEPLKIESQEDDIITFVGNQTKLRIINYPFTVRFYRNDLDVLFDGSRLIFDTSGVFTYSILYPKAASLYGLFQNSYDGFNLQDTSELVDPYRLKNVHQSYYNTTIGQYSSIPVIYAHSPNLTVGTFLHNAAVQYIDIKKDAEDNGFNTYVMVQNGVLDLFILLGPTPKDIVRQYTKLTGVTPLPQLWSLGYHHCSIADENQTYFEDVVANFDTYNFPLDSINIDYYMMGGNTTSKNYFEWDLIRFPDPLGLQHNLSSLNKKLFVIAPPQISVDSEYELYVNALNNSYLIEYPNGTLYEVSSWTSTSTSYIDFLNPAARDFYGSYFNYDKYFNTTETLAGFFVFHNEPQVGTGGSEETLLHGLFFYGNVSHTEIQNAYALLNIDAVYNGTKIRDNKKRPFIISRSHFSGSNRRSAITTGFTDASWLHLKVAVSQCLTANILGSVFCGSLIGGYYTAPSPEILQRWYQVAAWTPLFQVHGFSNREPYLYDELVQNSIRLAIFERYQHLPLMYTLFYEHARYGEPIMRPLFYMYPEKEELFSESQIFFVGPHVLVASVTSSGLVERNMHLPGQEMWYEIHTNRFYPGGFDYAVPLNVTYIPVFYRAASIIPKKLTPRLNTEEMKNDSYTIIVNQDLEGFAEGTLYVDDFESFDYQKGVYNYWKLTYSNNTIDILPIDGNGNFSLTIDKVLINIPSRKGTYDTVAYRYTSEGILLKDINISNEKLVFSLM